MEFDQQKELFKADMLEQNDQMRLLIQKEQDKLDQMKKDFEKERAEFEANHVWLSIKLVFFSLFFRQRKF